MPTPLQDNRIPQSMRLPVNEISIVHDFAESHRISKTDAFLHFLRKGIEAEESLGAQLDTMQAKLDRILTLVEKTPATLTKNSISHIVSDYAKQYTSILQVYLFGSFARGDATLSSDIDLRIVLQDDGSFSLFDLNRLKIDLEKELGRSVDIITASTLENPQLAAAIEKEKVLIYERKE